MQKCAFCSASFDASLMEGHQESCRLQQRRRERENCSQRPRAAQAAVSASSSPSTPSKTPSSSAVGTPLSPAEGNNIDDADEALCVVCWESPRVIAFVPCGHLVACAQCAAALKLCPICRQPRAALLRVDDSTVKRCVCKNCKQLIGPTFFDAHREICVMQMKQQAATQYGAEAAAQRNASLAAEEMNRICLNCHQCRKQKALLPCGHFILCAACADAAATCPLCLAPVRSTMAMFFA